MRTRLMMMTVAAALGAVAVEYRWTGKLQEPAPYNVPVWQGDTVVLAPLLESYGKAAVPASATLYWQTNGMGAAWFEKPAEVMADGRIRAVFHPTNDCGAKAYDYFIRAEIADGLAYRIRGKLEMRESPGFKPNTIAPPVPYLDFALTPYANAPWLLPAALEGYATEQWVAGFVAENAPTLTEADPVALPVAEAAQKAADAAMLAAGDAMTEAMGRTTPQDVEGIVSGMGFVVNGQERVSFGTYVAVGDINGPNYTSVNDGSILLSSHDYYGGADFFETFYTSYGIRSTRFLESDGWADRLTDFRLPARHDGVVTLATEEYVDAEVKAVEAAALRMVRERPLASSVPVFYQAAFAGITAATMTTAGAMLSYVAWPAHAAAGDRAVAVLRVSGRVREIVVVIRGSDFTDINAVRDWLTHPSTMRYATPLANAYLGTAQSQGTLLTYSRPVALTVRRQPWMVDERTIARTYMMVLAVDYEPFGLDDVGEYILWFDNPAVNIPVLAMGANFSHVWYLR